MIESYDLVLSAKSAPGNICAISTVEDIYLKCGFHVLDRTIRLIVQTWEGEQKSFSANYHEMDRDALTAEKAALEQAYKEFQAKGLKPNT